MCKAWEDIIREAAEKAAKEAAEEATIKAKRETEERVTLQNLRSVMKNLHLSVDQAMDALRIPESRRAQLAAKL